MRKIERQQQRDYYNKHKRYEWRLTKTVGYPIGADKRNEELQHIEQRVRVRG